MSIMNMRLEQLVLISLLVIGCLASVESFVTKPSFSAPLSTTLQMTVLSYNGKKKDFKPGTPLSTAVAQLGIKPKYSCKK